MADIDNINALIANREFDKAIVLLQTALEEEPNNIEFLKLIGLAEVNMAYWAVAKNHFETIVKYCPDDATSWFYLANCYNNLLDFVSAQNAYKKVLSLREEYIDAYKSLCVILLKLNETEDAIKYAFKATTYAPDDYIFDFVIGMAYIKCKNFEAAIKPLERAREKDSTNISIYNSLGTAYLASGRENDAIESYKKAIELDPNSPTAYFNLGSAYQIQNLHEAALEYLQKAIELDDEEESFKIAYAMSLIKLEKYEKASNVYKKLLVQHPEKQNYKFNLVTCYEAMGEINTAILMLEGMVYVNPKFILPAQKLANLYIQTNQLNKAKDIYDKILLKNNANAETLHQYAVLSSSLCDTDTAEKILKKTIRMNPNMAKAHKDLAVIYLNKRLFDYAEDEFKTAMKLMPNDFEIIFEYGNFLYSISKNTEAERYYEEALEIEPNNVLALTFMALNKLILNQLDSAKEYIMKALKENHDHEYILFCAGRIMYARGEYEDAKRYLIKAVEQNPDIETQNTLALTYHELGEYNLAINIFKNILNKFPKNVSVLKSISKSYAAANDNDNALLYLDKLVEILPEDEEAHELIRKLS